MAADSDDDNVGRMLTEVQVAHIELHAEVGHVASAWAMLEFNINKCIWMLAQLNPVAGACLTAQIISMAPRVDCLLALMKLRSMDEKSIGMLHRFKQGVYGVQEKRNRLIHDPFVYHSQTHKAGQIEITAKGKPVFRVKEISLDGVRKIHDEIMRLDAQFTPIYQAIFDARDALPDIPQPEADPMLVRMSLGTRNQSND